PITITSNDSMAELMARISIAGRQNPKDVSRETARFRGFDGRLFHVKRRGAGSCLPEMFHVKHPLTILLNQKSKFIEPGAALLSDTELPEDHVQDILDVDPAQQSPQRCRRRPQILRGQLLALPDRGQTALKRSRSILQQPSLAFPSDESALILPEVVGRKTDQGCDQIPDSIATHR